MSRKVPDLWHFGDLSLWGIIGVIMSVMWGAEAENTNLLSNEANASETARIAANVEQPNIVAARNIANETVVIDKSQYVVKPIDNVREMTVAQSAAALGDFNAAFGPRLSNDDTNMAIIWSSILNLLKPNRNAQA